MLKVGLTGGIGSGKSTVCEIFSQFGAPIIDTDQLARDVVKPGTAGLNSLIEAFGANIILTDGTLDRAALRQIAFSDPVKRQLLETIIHPLIRLRLQQQLSSLHAPYVIIAIPLLIEKNWQGEVDRILVVDCPEDMQLKRVLYRDGDESGLIRQIIQSQVSREQRLAAADDIIHNEADKQALRRQVEKLHQHYTRLAGAV